MLNKYSTDTKIGNKDLTKQIKTIKQDLISGYYGDNVSTEYGKIVMVTSELRDFTQPIVIEHNSDTLACFPAHQIISDGAERSIQLNYMKSYLILQWIAELGTQYRSDYKFAGIIFVKIISNNIKRTYNLTPEQTFTISLVLADYYNYLIGGNTMDLYTRSGGIMKFSDATSDQAEELASKELRYDSVNDLIDVFKMANISPKLTKFNAVSFYTLVAGIIHGVTAKEDIPLAMEYPPVWAWIVYRSLSTVSYKNTLLTKTAMVVSKKPEAKAKEFISAMAGIGKKLAAAQ